MYRPPSIQALRALEAAARLRSYSRAAAELGVTHGAISHRVREIEERLGTRMFERRGNAMEPTAAARQMLPALRQALGLVSSLFPPPEDTGRQVLRVGVLPSFAAHWLITRLAAFHAAHPNIAIALDARLELSAVQPGGVDAAIRYGSGDWPGLAVERLVGDVLYPACSPDYARQMGVESAADLARCHLLRNSWQPWTPWFRKAGLDLSEPVDSAPFEDAGLMLEAAVAGHGVALIRKVVARDALAQGRLVRLSEIEVPFEGAYHYVHSRAGSPKAVAVRAFGDWLGQQLRAEFPD